MGGSIMDANMESSKFGVGRNGVGRTCSTSWMDISTPINLGRIISTKDGQKNHVPRKIVD
jgi:hypothetical protein